jgi:hypothetical protein
MAISIEDIELRKEARLPQGVPASYALGAGARREAELIDLTGTGAGLLCDQPLSLNQCLSLHGPDAAPRQARVRWVAKQQDRFRLGLAFEPA